VTTSSQAELTKTSCFLGPAGTALYLLWLGAVRETKYRAFSHISQPKSVANSEISHYPLLFPDPKLREFAPFGSDSPERSEACAMAGVGQETQNPISSLINWLMPGNFPPAGELKDIGDWFRRTGSATRKSARTPLGSRHPQSLDYLVR
jgi:hypothetical protein